MTLRQVAWYGFWVYQIAGCIIAALYWEDIVAQYQIVLSMTEQVLR